MPCYAIYDLTGKKSGFICGDLGKHCAECGSVADILCDYPVGEGKTCDRSICDYHAHEVAPDIHYCDAHFSEFEQFRNNGGIKKELENVVPFKRDIRWINND